MTDLPTPAPASFIEVIDLWPTMAELARDIGSRQGVVNQWRNRNSIPAHAWPSIAEAATQRGFDAISVQLFADIAARLAAVRRESRKRPAPQGEVHA